MSIPTSHASDAKLNQVMCVTLTPDKQRLLVTDLKNRRIGSIDLATKVIKTVAENGKKGVPHDGMLFVADSWNHRVLRISLRNSY